MVYVGPRSQVLAHLFASPLLFGLTGAASAKDRSPPPSPIPQFPPGPDFAGVAGSAAEAARVASFCGANRNAADGYAPAPAFPGQTKAPIVHGRQGYAVQSVARIARPFGMDFLPDGRMLVSFRDGGLRIITRGSTR